MSTDHAPCVMTDTEQFYIRACGCGIIHLNFGPAVINVTAEVMIAITETLKEAASELRTRLNAEDPVNSGEAAIDVSGNVIVGRFPGHG